MNASNDEQGRRQVERATPTEALECPTGDQKRQRSAKLIPRADQADGPAALHRRKQFAATRMVGVQPRACAYPLQAQTNNKQ